MPTAAIGITVPSRCARTAGRTTSVATPVKGSGTIHLLILLHQGPPADGVDYTTPHPVAAVELDEQEGLRFTSTVIGAENSDIEVGARVSLEWTERNGRPYPLWRVAVTAP